MRVSVKICGITETRALEAAVDAGADAVGFVMAESSRRVDSARARALALDLPPTVKSVAVFHYPTIGELRSAAAQFTPDFIQVEPSPDVLQELDGTRLIPVFHDSDSLVARLDDYIQLRGTETPVHVEGPGRGGRGVPCDWSRAAAAARRGSVILAGGLTPDTVGEAIRRVRPHGVDVSSGVEGANGAKDPARIRAFIEAVRDVEACPPLAGRTKAMACG
ncbi:MAG: phosphoribosylanthranilate isomerase [Longimicrobiales bacterium]